MDKQTEHVADVPVQFSIPVDIWSCDSYGNPKTKRRAVSISCYVEVTAVHGLTIPPLRTTQQISVQSVNNQGAQLSRALTEGWTGT